MATPASAPLRPGQPGNASSGAAAKTRKRRRTRSLRRRWFGWTRPLVSRRALLVYTLLGATVAVFGMGGVFPSVYFPAYGLIELALVIGGVRVLAGKTQYHFDPLHVGLILVWCYGLGEWYFRVSPVARLGLTSLMHGGVAIAAFFLFSQVYQREQDQGWIGAWISLLVLALAVLGLAQWETAPHLIYWHFSYPYAHSFGPFVDRDEFAACMELLLPVSFWQTLRQRDRPDRMLLWGIIPLAGFIAVVVSRSLAGTLVVCCEGALGLGLGWYLQSRRTRKPQTDAAKAAEVSRSQRRQARNLRIMRWGLGGVALAAVSLYFTGLGNVGARILHLGTDISGQDRLLLDKITLRLWRQRPWLGWGLGTWRRAYFKLLPARTYSYFLYAHNDWLQLLDEMGVVGLASLVSLGGWGVRRLWRTRKWPRWQRNHLGWAAGLGCAGILLHSTVDFPLHMPANLLLFAILMSVMSSPGTINRDDSI